MSTFKDLIGSRATIRTALSLTKRLSPDGARRIVRFGAHVITSTQGAMYWAIHQNQAQVRGMRVDDPFLQGAVESVIMHAGQNYYDLFRYAALQKPVPIEMDEQSRSNLLAGMKQGRGVIAAGAHLSNFDFAIQHITAFQEIPVQVLSLAEPSPGFQLLNELRANPHCDVTPISNSALRAAIRRLREAGVVGTGVDRPVPGQLEHIEFFGRPTPLPTGHIRLALKTDSVVVPLWCEWSTKNGYRVKVSAPIEMERLRDSTASLQHNARRVIAALEPAIARQPDQWMMFIPVWPDDVG